MTQFFTKHNQAELWIEQFKAREEKKQAVLTPIEAQKNNSEDVQAQIHTPQVIFTRADVGHNIEETQKIQQLYHEIDDVSLRHVYAFA